MLIKQIFVSTRFFYWCYIILKLLYQPLLVLDAAQIKNTKVILAKKLQLKAIYATEYPFAISEIFSTLFIWQVGCFIGLKIS